MKYKQINLFGGEDKIGEPMTEQELYKEVRRAEGVDALHDKVEEELCELLIAIKHRKKNGTALVIEELADVKIMCEQLSLYYGHGNVDAVKQYKIKRLQERLESGEL